MPSSLKRRAEVPRRDFLKVLGVGAAASALPLTEVPAVAETRVADSGRVVAAPVAAKNNATVSGYVFFNSVETQFVEAAVDTLIPSDNVGPGALELGVATFIDRQLAGSYGKGYRLYLEGPFEEGTPEQGYQLKLTPAELMKTGIADVSAYVSRRYNSNFSDLKPNERAVVLSDIEKGKVGLATVPNATFFSLLLQLTVEGYFSDPIHGGNKNKAAWKMIGFPGAGVIFTDLIGKYRNKQYDVEPVDIQDLS
jgi:Gluconate 2-dehydrogenase subunit 3/TAT (twin-arginine translocation) pathway signal sequence